MKAKIAEEWMMKSLETCILSWLKDLECLDLIFEELSLIQEQVDKIIWEEQSGYNESIAYLLASLDDIYYSDPEKDEYCEETLKACNEVKFLCFNMLKVLHLSLFKN